jgi:hypothetical protein
MILLLSSKKNTNKKKSSKQQNIVLSQPYWCERDERLIFLIVAAKAQRHAYTHTQQSIETTT